MRRLHKNEDIMELRDTTTQGCCENSRMLRELNKEDIQKNENSTTKLYGRKLLGASNLLQHNQD